MAKASKLIAISRSGHVFLVYKNGLWSLLGGRRLAGETDRQCIERERDEEVTGLRLRNLRFWKKFSGPNRTSKKLRSKRKMDDAIFVARGWGFVQVKSEVHGVGWFLNWKKLPLTPTTRRALKVYMAAI